MGDEFRGEIAKRKGEAAPWQTRRMHLRLEILNAQEVLWDSITKIVINRRWNTNAMTIIVKNLEIIMILNIKLKATFANRLTICAADFVFQTSAFNTGGQSSQLSTFCLQCDSPLRQMLFHSQKFLQACQSISPFDIILHHLFRQWIWHRASAYRYPAELKQQC